ncbi:PLD nuclease N-terminal domain-containing protein [Herbiconiux sp. L3-i23]|uniref:PLD nuclease N-terminal domain-containing protein n=1 Tax=Herbiconiux sp. L3-i23 TaxID=2905871 RepID=UPI002047464E|nr:PLD nuclease N-terminal domain-containing protein [Herbiconiux sp. L3-i23]BDI23161.1 hypothetical protein L3i23_19370 [Herbiconiux sp. L3-i23]
MIVLSFLLLVLVIGALVDVVRAPLDQVKRGTKAGWLLAVLLLPGIGGALWFAFGRRRGSYDLDEYIEEPAPHDPARAAERIGSVDGPTERVDDGPRLPTPPEGPRSTEEQLADLEAEIAYWEDWSQRRGTAALPAGSQPGDDPSPARD